MIEQAAVVNLFTAISSALLQVRKLFSYYGLLGKGLYLKRFLQRTSFKNAFVLLKQSGFEHLESYYKWFSTAK